MTILIIALVVVIVPLFFGMGLLMHALFMRFNVSVFNTLLVNFGLTVIIDSAIQWIWTGDYRKLETPYASIKFTVGSFYFPLPEVLTLLLSTSLALSTWAVLRYTRAGKAMRAISMDPAMARAFGLHGERVEKADDLDGAIGRALAAVAQGQPALLDVLVTPEAASSDAKSGLAWVPDLQALQAWDDAERQWRLQSA